MKKLVLMLLFFGILAGAIAQEMVTFSGTVYDAQTKETIVGASVLHKGTTIGTVTNIDGKFSIDVPMHAIVNVSFVGLQSREIEVTEAVSMDIYLDPTTLEEVVVLGYSTQKKEDITAAVAIVDSDDLENISYADPMQALQGKVSGVTIQQDGAPGSNRTEVRVRGVTTINNNSPLYVIDGIPSTEGLTNINPNDIASIQVLKDAASASIYGSRSANGVIVVTTKQGSDGATSKVSIDAGTLQSYQSLSNELNLLDATEWGQVYYDAYMNTYGEVPGYFAALGSAPGDEYFYYDQSGNVSVRTIPILAQNGTQTYVLTPEGTDWFDEVYTNARSQKYWLNVSNNTDNGSYYLGASYFTQDGIIEHTYYDRLSVKANSSYKVTDFITIGENLNLSSSEQVSAGSQQGQDGIPLDVIRQSPVLPVYDYEGNYAGKDRLLPDVRNMVSVLEKNKDNTEDGLSIFGNAYLDVNILDAFEATKEHHDLIYKSNIGVEYVNYYKRDFSARYSEGNYDVQDNSLTNDYGRKLTKTFTNTLNYHYTKGVHNGTFLAGMESVQYDSYYLIGTATDFEIEDPDYTYLNAAGGSQTNYGGGTEWGLYSYFGRFDYTYDSKYIVSGTVRRDASSRFNDVGYFPAGSVGWRFTNEDFFDKTFGKKILTDGKFRVSAGQQGNQTADDFAMLSLLGSSNVYPSPNYDFSGDNTTTTQGYQVLSKGNTNLTWETTTQINYGVDLSFLKGALELSFDYYTKKTEDILLGQPQLATTGEGSDPYVNIGDLEGNGFDMNLTYNYFNPNRDLDISATFQVNKYTHEVTNLGDFASIGYEGESYIEGDDVARIATGQPLGVFYGYVVDGIFQNEEEVDAHASQEGAGVGRLIYKDVNEDGEINDQDRTYIGNPYPDLNLGLNLSANYKNFSLTMFFYSSIGQDVYNHVLEYTDFAQNAQFNHSTRILDSWTPENTDTDIPMLTVDDQGNGEITNASSYFVEDGSFVKLRTVRLGYTFPELVNGMKLNIYGEVQNVFTITNYSGVDPEVPYASGVNYPGIDYGVYPLPRVFMVGMNLNL